MLSDLTWHVLDFLSYYLVQNGETKHTVPYEWTLSSRNGARFILKPHKACPAECIDAVKHHIRRTRDPISIEVARAR